MGWETLFFDTLLALSLAMLIGKLFEELVLRAGLPPVLGDLIAGLILGLSFLSIYPVNDVVKVFSWFGVSLLLFYAGLETRYREFMKNLRLFSIITIGEAIAAFGIGYLIGIAFGYSPRSAYFIGAVLEATSISVSVRTLMDIGKLTTLEGYAILGVAVLDDLTALVIIVAGTSLILTGVFSVSELVKTAIVALIYWLAVVMVLHRLSSIMMRYLFKIRAGEGSVAIVLGIFALLSYLAKYLGLSPLIAAYAVGLALSEAPRIWRVVERFRPMALLFSVLFFMTTAAELNIWEALKPQYIPFYVALLGGAFLGKILGGGLTSMIIGYPPISALRIATGLLPRAEFCIIAAYIGYSYGLFGPEIYLSAILIVLVTNFITPITLKTLFSYGGEVTHITPIWKRLRKLSQKSSQT